MIIMIYDVCQCHCRPVSGQWTKYDGQGEIISRYASRRMDQGYGNVTKPAVITFPVAEHLIALRPGPNYTAQSF